MKTIIRFRDWVNGLDSEQFFALNLAVGLTALAVFMVLEWIFK